MTFVRNTINGMTKRVRAAVAFGLTAAVLSLATSAASALPPQKGPPDPTNPTGNPTVPPRPQPSHFVPFNGATVVDVVTNPFPIPHPGTVKQVMSFNLKDQMIQVYNTAAAQMEQQLRVLLSDKKNTGGHELKNVRLRLARANASSKMFLKVDSKNKTFDIDFIVPGSEVDFEVEIFGPNPSMRVKFDLAVHMFVFADAGPKHGPLQLNSATVSLTNVKVDGNVIFDIENFVAGIFGQNLTAAIPKSINITDKVRGLFTLINGRLLKFVSNPTVTPKYDATKREFELFMSEKKSLPVLKELTKP